MSNPFLSSSSRAGHGEIALSILPPHTPRLKTCSYQYPLKLVAPDPLHVDDGTLVHTVYLLSYGGGLVGGDAVNLSVNLDPTTRLVLLTQGSTKIFISPKPEVITRQVLHVHLQEESALCYLPDPVQPFAQSAFEQSQIYTLSSLHSANLCVCDWVCRGRSARGENWNFWRYTSKNEIWLSPPPSSAGERPKKRLLLRDNLLLEDGTATGSFANRMDSKGAYGTLILHGPMFSALGKFFMGEFEAMPRIGARNWDDETEAVDAKASARKSRETQEKKDELLWTAAQVRGFVLIKFGAREVEGVKKWLAGMLRAEGSVERLFGERALMCLRS
jgi:urease accessory protein